MHIVPTPYLACDVALLIFYPCSNHPNEFPPVIQSSHSYLASEFDPVIPTALLASKVDPVVSTLTFHLSFLFSPFLFSYLSIEVDPVVLFSSECGHSLLYHGHEGQSMFQKKTHKTL